MLQVWFGLCLSPCELQGLVLGKFTSKSIMKCINYANIYSWFLGYWTVILSLTVIHSPGDTADVVCHLSTWIMVACPTLSSTGSCFNHQDMPNPAGLCLYGLHCSVLSQCELAVCKAEQTWARMQVLEAWACWHPAVVNFCQCGFPIRLFKQMLSKCRRDLFLEVEVGLGRVGGSEMAIKIPILYPKGWIPTSGWEEKQMLSRPRRLNIPRNRMIYF